MITTFDELCLRLPCSRSTVYNHALDKMDDIKELLEGKKLKVKEHLKGKWFKSDNPTLQIGLYKLLATDEEYLRLANAKQEIQTINKEMPVNEGELMQELKKIANDRGITVDELMEREGIDG